LTGGTAQNKWSVSLADLRQRISQVTQMPADSFHLELDKERLTDGTAKVAFLGGPFTVSPVGLQTLPPVVPQLSKAALKRKAALHEREGAEPITRRLRSASASTSRRRVTRGDDDDDLVDAGALDDDGDGEFVSQHRVRVARRPIVAEAPKRMARLLRKKANAEDDDGAGEWVPTLSRRAKQKALLADHGSAASLAAQAQAVSAQLFTVPVLSAILWWLAEDGSAYAAFRLVCRAWRDAQMRDWQSFDKLVTSDTAINWQRRDDDGAPLNHIDGSLKQGATQRLFALSRRELEQLRDESDVCTQQEEENRYSWSPRGEIRARKFNIVVSFFNVALVWDWLCEDEEDDDDDEVSQDDDEEDSMSDNDTKIKANANDRKKENAGRQRDRAYALLSQRCELRMTRHLLKRRRTTATRASADAEKRRAAVMRYLEVDVAFANVQPELADLVDVNVGDPKAVAAKITARWNRRLAMNAQLRELDETAPLDWWQVIRAYDTRIDDFIFDGAGGDEAAAFLRAAFARQAELKRELVQAGVPITVASTSRDDVRRFIAGAPPVVRWYDPPKVFTAASLAADIKVEHACERRKRRESRARTKRRSVLRRAIEKPVKRRVWQLMLVDAVVKAFVEDGKGEERAIERVRQQASEHADDDDDDDDDDNDDDDDAEDLDEDES
jgi:hypothetical protein